MVLTRQKIKASWCFLVAALIAFYVAAHFYLDSKYPTSAEFIKRSLSSPRITRQFKIEEAKKAGYSEEEIAEYLAQSYSEKFRKYRNRIIMVEGTVFVISLLVGFGLLILKANGRKGER